jgi:hypothetical protein
MDAEKKNQRDSRADSARHPFHAPSHPITHDFGHSNLANSGFIRTTKKAWDRVSIEVEP